MTEWKHRPADAKLLASVVISTKNRAEYVAESINSVLAQTVRDFEVVVVDDGSDDETSRVVEGFTDPRLRLFKRKAAGIAASRNFAATVSRGRFTVIHDDDDLMFPDRIENHFKALRAGDSGTYGGWIDFDNRNGEVVASNPGKTFTFENLLYNGRIFAHATLMLETQLIRSVGYDERLRSGSDFNLAVRLGRHGVSLNHTGKYHLVRRIHPKQVTSVDSSRQKSSATMTLASVLSTIPAGRQNALRKELRNLPDHTKLAGQDAAALVKPYLPDHLVVRDLVFNVNQAHLVPAAMAGEDRLFVTRILDHLSSDDGEDTALLKSATWGELAELRAAGVEFDVTSSRFSFESPEERLNPIALMRGMVRTAVANSDAALHVVISSTGDDLVAVDAPLLLHKTVTNSGASISAQVHSIPEDFNARPLLAEVSSSAGALSVEFHQSNVVPGAPGHWDILEGITK